MTIEFPDELSQHINRVAKGEGIDATAYVTNVVEEDLKRRQKTIVSIDGVDVTSTDDDPFPLRDLTEGR